MPDDGNTSPSTGDLGFSGVMPTITIVPPRRVSRGISSTVLEADRLNGQSTKSGTIARTARRTLPAGWMACVDASRASSSFASSRRSR